MASSIFYDIYQIIQNMIHMYDYMILVQFTSSKSFFKDATTEA